MGGPLEPLAPRLRRTPANAPSYLRLRAGRDVAGAEVAFAFRVTPTVLVVSILFALGLGLLGGAWPAWRAARMTPTEALRRH